MGAYLELEIGGKVVWSEKNSAIPFVEALFSEENRRETSIPIEERVEDGPTESISYVTNVADAKLRLAAHGHTLETARRTYCNAENEIANESGEFHALDKVDHEFYRRVSFERYRTLLFAGFDEDKGWDSLCPDMRYIFQCPSFHQWAFPSEKYGDLLAVLLSGFPDTDEIRLCLDSWIGSEFWETDKPFVGDTDAKIIVMTEGKTDAEALSASIEIVDPTLADVLRFFDYDHRPEGGAGIMPKMLRAFAAAGIKEPVLAVFDNDAAGHQSLHAAKGNKLPSNFLCTCLPDLDLARAYPTVGPTGNQILDVNGKACGIELYLGKACLTKNGELIPIHWKGYNEVIQRYQGSLLDKRHPYDAFLGQLRKITAGEMPKSRADFSGIEAICSHLRTAIISHSWVDG